MSAARNLSEIPGRRRYEVEGPRVAPFVPAGVPPSSALDSAVAAVLVAWARGDPNRAAAVRMVCIEGASLRSVEMALGVPKSTVHGWAASFRAAMQAVADAAEFREEITSP